MQQYWIPFAKRKVPETPHKVLLWNLNEFGFGFPTVHWDSDTANKYYAYNKTTITHWVVVPCPDQEPEKRVHRLVHSFWVHLKKKLPLRTPDMFLVGGRNQYSLLTPYKLQIELLQQMQHTQTTSYSHWMSIKGPKKI